MPPVDSYEIKTKMLKMPIKWAFFVLIKNTFNKTFVCKNTIDL